MKDIAFFDAPAGSTRQRKRSNLKSKHSNIRILRQAGDGWSTSNMEVVSPSGQVIEPRTSTANVKYSSYSRTFRCMLTELELRKRKK